MAYAERTKGRLTGRWFGEVDTRQADGTRHRVRKPFKTKGDAEGFEAYVKATGDMPPHMVSAPTFSFYSVAEHFSSRNKEWINAHDGQTNAQRLRFAIDHLGALDIRAIRTAELERYADKVRAQAGVSGKPPANRTVNRYLHAVSKVLRFAHERDLIQGLPKVPYMKDEGMTRDVLTWAQEDTICAHMERQGHGHMAFCVRVLAGTGMRRGELLSLRPEQIEDRGIALTKEQTKTNAARWVPIVPVAARRLRGMLAKGDMPEAAQLYQAFKAAARALGEPESLTLHCLRHTTVTRMLDTGASWLKVAEIVGHKAGVMTGRYYHPNKDELFAVAEKVQIRLGETPIMGQVVPLILQEKIA